MRIFFKFCLGAQVASVLSGFLVVFVFYSDFPSKPLLFLWLGAVIFTTLVWFVMAAMDKRPTPRPRSNPLPRYLLLASLLAVLFGLFFTYEFPLASRLEQVFLGVFMFSLLTSGVFIYSPSPAVALTWIFVLSAFIVSTILGIEDPHAAVFLLFYLFYVLYLLHILVNFSKVFQESIENRVRAEEREREFAVIFEQSPLSIVVTDAEAKILQANKKMEELSGYTKQELIGNNPRLLNSGKTARTTYQDLWATILKGETWHGEFNNKNKKNEEYLEKASISPVKGADNVIQKFVAIKEDITAQRRLEEELQERNELIKFLLRDFEEKAGDWLWELDPDLRVSYVSDKVYSKFLKTTSSVLGRSIVDLLKEHLPPDDAEAERLNGEFLAALKKNVPFDELELKFSIDGMTAWALVSAAPVAKDFAKPVHWRGVGRDITDRKVLELELKRRANYDELTGLANRFQFIEIVDASLNSEMYSVALLGIVELGNLKMIRSTLGSRLSNSVLKTFVQRIISELGTNVILARLGHDEFVFLILEPDLDQVEKIHSFAHLMDKPIDIGSDVIHLEIKIGIAFYPDDALDRRDLLQAADLALSNVKASPTRRVMRYRQDLAENLIHRLNLIKDLPVALTLDQFEMLYQVQVNVQDDGIVGAEALIRWYHPEKGLISPSEFVPLAEHSGFIILLGKWILDQACVDAMTWPEPWKVSVNISALQVRHIHELVNDVNHALKVSNLPPSRLILEITESAMFSEDRDVMNAFVELRRQGIQIALDDFGTGYSSLAYIKKLPLDKLKIDHSFVKKIGVDGETEKLISIILELAKLMNLKTVAEGVEEERQIDFLKGKGCDWFQGYLYGKPMNLPDFNERFGKAKGTARGQ